MFRVLQGFMLLAVLLVLPSFAPAYQPFPDTGQTMCYDTSHNAVSCDTIEPGDFRYGQDAHYQPRLPRSYTKLGYDGAELPDDEPHADNDGKWIMTRDNVTGLIWEIKTTDNKNNQYNWQDSQEKFVSGLNEDEFGGFSDWRLPTIQELASITNLGESFPAINTDFFPNTASTTQLKYWSSTSSVIGEGNAWRVNFRTGYLYYDHKSESYYVRAVRGEQPPANNFVDNQDGTITDKTTGLMWQKCTLGRTWDDIRKICTGFAKNLNWGMALGEAEGLELAGYNDWRIPNINELRTLVDYKKINPAIDEDFFPDTLYYPQSGWYWTSTTFEQPGSKSWAWLIQLSRGWEGTFLKSSGGMPDDPLNMRRYAYAVRAGYSYTEGLGSIIISIKPDEAAEAGAQWSIKEKGIWYYSGETANNVPAGTHTIEFQGVPGWRPEGTIDVTVEEDKTVTLTITYLEQPSALPGVMMLLLEDE